MLFLLQLWELCLNRRGGNARGDLLPGRGGQARLSRSGLHQQSECEPPGSSLCIEQSRDSQKKGAGRSQGKVKCLFLRRCPLAGLGCGLMQQVNEVRGWEQQISPEAACPTAASPGSCLARDRLHISQKDPATSFSPLPVAR